MFALPHLVTDRLTLTPVTPADHRDLAALEADPEVMRHLAGGDYLQPRGTEPEVLAARLRRGGRFIGWFAVFDDGLVQGARQGELGYRLHRAFWGQGYASEGALALADLALDALGFDLIRAEVAAGNTGSRRVLEKTGFRLAGSLAAGELAYERRRNGA